VKEYLGSFEDSNVDLLGLQDKLTAATAVLTQAQSELDAARSNGSNFFDYYDPSHLDPLQQAVIDAQKEVDRLNDLYKVGTSALNAQANAAEFLSLSLGKIKQEALEKLEDAEQQALQDAIKLNDLFEDRKQLLEDIAKAQEDFNAAQFKLLTADSVVRRKAGVVERGGELVKLRAEFEEKKKQNNDRLAALNLEIITQSKIVTEEGKIFNLAGSIAELRARSQALTFANQQREIAGWREILAIANGIHQLADGTFAIDPALRDRLTGVPPAPGAETAAQQRTGTTDNSTVQNTFEFQVNVSGDVSTQEKKQIGREIWESILNEGVRLGFNNE